MSKKRKSLRVLLLIALIAPCALNARDAFSFFSKKKTENSYLIENLHGVFLCGHTAPPSSKEIKECRGILFKDIPPPPEDLRRLLGKPLTKQSLERLCSHLRHHYEKSANLLMRIESRLESSVLVLTLEPLVVESVHIHGNPGSSAEKTLQAMHLKIGEQLRPSLFFADLNWLNRNPFQKVDAVFSSNDVDLIVSKRFPLRSYGGVDNTGNHRTGVARWYLGLDWADVLIRGAQFSYQFTANSDISRFYSQLARYQIPLPWRHELYLYGNYSHVHNIKKGSDIQTGMRYNLPLQPRFGTFLHELFFGYDFKRMNNNLEFGGHIITSHYAQINQFLLGYFLDYKTKKHSTHFKIEAVGAPFEQTEMAFDRIHPLSSSRYFYARGRILHTLYLPRSFSLIAAWAGQWASGNLLTSEQFGLGGYNTVRGYTERAVNVDSALLFNLEIHSPKLSIAKLYRSLRTKDALEFLAFADYGLGKNHKGAPSHHLIGVGPGVRYTYSPYFALRADLGIPLHKDPSLSNKTVRWHVGGTLSY